MPTSQKCQLNSPRTFERILLPSISNSAKRGGANASLPPDLPPPLPPGSSGPEFFVDKWSLTCVLFFDFHAKMLAKYPLASTCLQLQKLEKDPRKREYFSTSQRLHNEVDSFLKYHLCFCIQAFSSIFIF